MMFNRILVLLDGSACAEQALPIAASIARSSDSSVHAYGQAGTAIRIARLSDPEDLTILDAADEQRADLIILASHRANRIKKWIQGSVAQKVARARPILVLHDGRTLPLSSLPGKKRPLHPLSAVVALDGSRTAETAILPAAQLVAALATQAQGEMYLTRVVQRPAIDALLSSLERIDWLQRAQAVNEAIDYVHALTDTLCSSCASYQNLAFSWSIAIANDVSNGLLRIAEEGIADGGTCPLGGCEFLALATHGHCGKQGLLSSVTECILDRSKLPLLIVQPQ